MNQTHFYISQSGRELGPLELTEILTQHETGQLSAADFVYVEEREDWLSLTDFLATYKKSTPKKLDQKIVQEIAKDIVTDFPTDLHYEFSKPTLATTFTNAPPKTIDMPIISKVESIDIEPLKSNSPVDVLQKTHTDLNTGEFYLDDLKAGTFYVSIQDKNNSSLKERIELNVAPGIAQKIRVNLPAQVRAGESILLTAEALDLNLDLAISFQQTISGKYLRKETSTSDSSKPLASEILQFSQPNQKTTESKSFNLVFLNGKASIMLKENKAGTFSLSYDTHMSLLVENTEFVVEASNPHSIKVEAPSEVRAGEKIKIRLAAFDEFENRCNSLSSTFKVDIESQNGNVLTSYVELKKSV